MKKIEETDSTSQKAVVRGVIDEQVSELEDIKHHIRLVITINHDN